MILVLYIYADELVGCDVNKLFVDVELLFVTHVVFINKSDNQQYSHFKIHNHDQSNFGRSQTESGEGFGGNHFRNGQRTCRSGRGSIAHVQRPRTQRPLASAAVHEVLHHVAVAVHRLRAHAAVTVAKVEVGHFERGDVLPQNCQLSGNKQAFIEFPDGKADVAPY